MSNPLDALLFGVRAIVVNGVSMAARSVLSIEGDVTAVDDSANGATKITVTGGGSGSGDGNVRGPVSSLLGRIAIFADGTGKLIADSGYLLSDVLASIVGKAAAVHVHAIADITGLEARLKPTVPTGATRVSALVAAETELDQASMIYEFAPLPPNATVSVRVGGVFRGDGMEEVGYGNSTVSGEWHLSAETLVGEIPAAEIEPLGDLVEHGHDIPELVLSTKDGVLSIWSMQHGDNGCWLLAIEGIVLQRETFSRENDL